MIDKDNERHRYGQHYTPEVVARLLAALAIRAPGDLAFDPSCGDGRLLEAAHSMKVALAGILMNGPGAGTQALSRSGPSIPCNSADELFGIDRSPKAVAAARHTGAQVAVADFFEVRPGCRLSRSFDLPAQFDAIIGNPPYIRQELLGDDRSRIKRVVNEAATGAKPPSGARPGRASRNTLLINGLDGEANPRDQIQVPRWSGRSDIYVYFFAHATGFLRSGGRLVYLTASSWLDVGYGMQLQEFMLRNFKIVMVLESAVESFFAGASVNTSITVLEREPDRDRRINNQVKFVQMLKPLADIITDSPLETIRLARDIESGSCLQETRTMRIRSVEQRYLLDAAYALPTAGTGQTHRRAGRSYLATKRPATWGRFLRAEDVFFRVLDKGHQRFARLSDLASVRFGVKTGANEFFYLKPGDSGNGQAIHSISPAMRPLESLARVRRGMTTGANEFFYLRSSRSTETGGRGGCVAVKNSNGVIIQIESRYLRPVVFSLKEIPKIEIRDAGTRMLFFDCPDLPGELKGTEASKYIKAGERAGIHLRPTCSSRVPWYDVARGKQPAPLIFPSKVGERWLVAINRAGVYEDKKLYGVFPHPQVPVALLAALLNSTWARYYAEMTCRQLTGAQAIADIDVVVAEQVLLPDPEVFGTPERRRLMAALCALSLRPVYSIFEEVQREDRRLLDELVLAAIGFSHEAERREVLLQIYRASTDLVRLRLARSRFRIGSEANIE